MNFISFPAWSRFWTELVAVQGATLMISGSCILAATVPRFRKKMQPFAAPTALGVWCYSSVGSLLSAFEPHLPTAPIVFVVFACSLFAYLPVVILHALTAWNSAPAARWSRSTGGVQLVQVLAPATVLADFTLSLAFVSYGAFK